MTEEQMEEDKKQKEDWDRYVKRDMTHWRSWGSWFSWGSPVGLGIWFVCASIALAITLIAVGRFIVMMGWIG